jgi:DUF4097 and DUF4098 domain-containing protein YvlB
MKKKIFILVFFLSLFTIFVSAENTDNTVIIENNFNLKIDADGIKLNTTNIDLKINSSGIQYKNRKNSDRLNNLTSEISLNIEKNENDNIGDSFWENLKQNFSNFLEEFNTKMNLKPDSAQKDNNNETLNLDLNFSENSNNVENIDIIIIGSNVEFITTENSNIDIKWTGEIIAENALKRFQPEITRDKKTVKVIMKTNKKYNNGNSKYKSTVKIEIPNKVFNQISVNTVSGNVKNTNLIKSDNFQLKTVSGDGKLINIQSEKSHFATTSGDVSINSITVKDFTAKTVSGDFKIKNLESSNISFNSTSGDLNIEMMKANDVTAKTVSGDIKIDKVNAENKLMINTVSGDVKLGSDYKNPFTFNFNTVSGKFSNKALLTVENMKKGSANGFNKNKSGCQYIIKSVSGDLEFFI